MQTCASWTGLTSHRPELAWIGTESNEFGTDEFMKWCEVVGTEPYLCLNFGTGTLDEGKQHIHRAFAYVTDYIQLLGGLNTATQTATHTTPIFAGKMVVKSHTM